MKRSHSKEPKPAWFSVVPCIRCGVTTERTRVFWYRGKVCVRIDCLCGKFKRWDGKPK